MTDGQPGRFEARLTKFAWWWFAGLALTYLSTWPLSRLDNATVLTPDNTPMLGLCVLLAGLVALVSALVCFFQSTGTMAARMVMSLMGFGIGGGVGTLLFLSTLANIAENRRLFPSETTRTYWALLPIERAWRSDARSNRSWIIQPAPYSAEINITHADYRRMLPGTAAANRRSKPKSVSSRSRFCAKVQMQQSGAALRVLHAGKGSLPVGTVGVCSEMAAREPSLERVR